jgi:DNA-binding GntR family transcriptional regulator
MSESSASAQREPSQVVSQAGLPQNLRSQALGEQIAEVLAQAIVSQRIPPGSRLSEDDLAAQFGTSRTPVRDAFKLLASEHLVLIMPRRGVRVLDFDGRRVVDIYQIRSRLHGLAAGLAAQRGNEGQRADVVECARAMTTAAAADDLDAFLAANVDFHNTLELAADNLFVTSSLAGLGRLTLHLRRRGLSLEGRMAVSAESHRKVAEAIGRGDSPLAEELTRRLILDAGAHILREDFPENAEAWIAMLDYGKP